VPIYHPRISIDRYWRNNEWLNRAGQTPMPFRESGSSLFLSCSHWPRIMLCSWHLGPNVRSSSSPSTSAEKLRTEPLTWLSCTLNWKQGIAKRKQDRKTDRKTKRKTDRQTDRQKDRQTDRQKEGTPCYVMTNFL